MSLQKFNVNDIVWVRLTEAGEKLWAAYWMRFPQLGYEGVPKAVRHEDSEGRTQFQLWELMEIFGPAMHMGMAQSPFKHNDIWLEKPLENTAKVG